MTDTPHFDLPFRLENGDFAVVEQDSQDEVTNCVFAVRAYRPGQRIELSDFGVPDQTLRETIDSEAVKAAIVHWEPRAATSVDIYIDLTNPGNFYETDNVKLRASV